MPSPPPTDDLLDLRMLPAWVNEPARPNDYANFEGEDAEATARRQDRPRNRDREHRGPRTADRRKERAARGRDRAPRRPHDAKRDHRPSRERQPQIEAEPLAVTVR